MAIEFMQWYGPAERMVRCGGDDGCGALLMHGDAELHQQWHDKVYPFTEVTLYIDAPAEPGEVAERVAEKIRLALPR